MDAGGGGTGDPELLNQIKKKKRTIQMKQNVLKCTPVCCYSENKNTKETHPYQKQNFEVIGKYGLPDSYFEETTK